MADFFGGILDTLRTGGDDVSSFFGTSLGSALEYGIAGGQEKSNSVNKLFEASKLASEDNVSVNPGVYTPPKNSVRPIPAEDFGVIEQEWLRRIMRFGQLEGNFSSQVAEKK